MTMTMTCREAVTAEYLMQVKLTLVKVELETFLVRLFMLQGYVVKKALRGCPKPQRKESVPPCKIP